MNIPNSVTDEKDVLEMAEKIQEDFDKQDYGSGTGGYSGKKPAGKGSKTVKSLRDQVIAASANHTRQELEMILARELKHFLNFLRHKPEKKDYHIDQYLKWLNASLATKEAVWNEEQDVECEQFGARGPGGQNVNKTEMAIRCVHRPTLIKSMNQDSRDMEENKIEAKAILRGRLDIHLARWQNYMRSFHGDVTVTPDLFWAAVTADEKL